MKRVLLFPDRLENSLVHVAVMRVLAVLALLVALCAPRRAA